MTANNMNPLVTIAIPTYKRADDYLKQTLESAVSQTYQNIEIIISDNCSPDDTEKVVKSFNDSRIRYIRHKENIGPANNFNFCVNEAKGVYFQLLQDDDLIDKDFIESCVRALSGHTNVGLIRTGTRIIDENGTYRAKYLNMVEGLSIEDFFRGWFAGKTAPYLCSTLFNTKRLQEMGGFYSQHQLFLDVVAEFQLAARYGRIDIANVKASNRRHSAELTFASKVKNWCEDSFFLLDIMCDLVPEASKKIVKDEGMVFLARLNYNRAKAVKSPGMRVTAYWEVFRKFNYRYLPSRYHFYASFRNQLYGTAIYTVLRAVKRRLMRA